MSNKTSWVVMKIEASAIGGMTHFRDIGSRTEAEKLINSADGMRLTLMSRSDYENWHNSNIKPYYKEH